MFGSTCSLFFFLFEDIAFAVYIIKYKFFKMLMTSDQDDAFNGGYSKNLQDLQGSDRAQSLAQMAGR